jgi:hypothetical protein
MPVFPGLARLRVATEARVHLLAHYPCTREADPFDKMSGARVMITHTDDRLWVISP